MKLRSCVQLFATPWTVAYQASPSIGFSRQEYWSALPFPSPGDLPDPGIEPRSLALEADTLSSEPPGKHNLPNNGSDILTDFGVGAVHRVSMLVEGRVIQVIDFS